MTKFVADSNGQVSNHISLGNAKVIAVGVTSVELAAPVGASVQIIRLCSDVACHYVIGTSPQTAASGNALLPAFTIEYMGIEPGETVAVIQDTATGTLSVVEAL